MLAVKARKKYLMLWYLGFGSPFERWKDKVGHIQVRHLQYNLMNYVDCN